MRACRPWSGRENSGKTSTIVSALFPSRFHLCGNVRKTSCSWHSIFLDKFSLRPPAPELSAESAQLLKSHSWAGNVRELQNVIERALILAEDELLILPEHMLMPATGAHS